MADQEIIVVEGMRLVKPTSPEQARRVAARYLQAAQEWETEDKAVAAHNSKVAQKFLELAAQMEG